MKITYFLVFLDSQVLVLMLKLISINFISVELRMLKKRPQEVLSE